MLGKFELELLAAFQGRALCSMSFIENPDLLPKTFKGWVYKFFKWAPYDELRRLEDAGLIFFSFATPRGNNNPYEKRWYLLSELGEEVTDQYILQERKRRTL